MTHKVSIEPMMAVSDYHATRYTYPSGNAMHLDFPRFYFETTTVAINWETQSE